MPKTQNDKIYFFTFNKKISTFENYEMWRNIYVFSTEGQKTALQKFKIFIFGNPWLKVT